MIDTLLDAHLADGQPSADFDARFKARLHALETEEIATLDATLAADSPVPSADFNGAVHAMLDAARATEEDALDALLAVDDPRPSAGFDARFADRLAAADEMALDAMLALDEPRPSANFDATFKNRLAEAQLADAGHAKVLRFRRFAWIAIPLAAAAALFLWLRPTPLTPSATPTLAPEATLAAGLPQLEMLEDLEMLEHLDEIEMLEGLEDPEIFALVAQLDTLALDPLPEALP